MHRKINYIYIVLAITILNSTFLLSQDFETLYGLHKKKDFFVFRELVKNYSNRENPWQAGFLQALSGNVFGNPKESNEKLNSILSNYLQVIPDSVLTVIYEIKASNHISLFEYKSAYETALLLNSGYSGFLESDEKDELENELIIWKALQNVPPQKISKKGDVSVPLKKDAAEMWNIPVKLKNKNFNFIFDTGANFCVISETLARELGFDIIENAKFKVGTSTAKKVEAKIAISGRFYIGNITIENSIFIMLPDKALKFGDYKIRGIIGNPIIKALDEIIIINNNELFVPEQPEKSSIKNLAFDGFTPIIQMIYNQDSLNFIFDTGGQETYLYYPFYVKYQELIKGKYNPVKIKIGGAGGSIEVNGFILDKLNLFSGSSKLELNEVKLITDKLQDFDEYFYGHLGQDFYKEFSKIKINYFDMYIEFVK